MKTRDGVTLNADIYRLQANRFHSKRIPGKVVVDRIGFHPTAHTRALGGSMRKHLLLLLTATSSLCVLLIPQPSLGDEVPKIAWRRPLGQPLENPSPVFPGNYKESSCPVAIYRWHA